VQTVAILYFGKTRLSSDSYPTMFMHPGEI
jgi:hypothetical protein